LLFRLAYRATFGITVIDGEVIPVENTPPPPLPEPPPTISDNINNNGYKEYSTTTMDGELILLFRLAY
jgi:hypothetical protein